VGIVLIAERQRRPALSFEIEPVAPIRQDGAKFLRVRVRNHGLPRFLAAVYERQPALLTRVWITFYHLDGEPVFAHGRRMRGRWSDTPDPFRATPVSPTMLVNVVEPFATSNSIDIPADDYETLDVVMRGPDTEECVGWSNAHQMAIAGAPPPVGETLTLSRGIYLVQLEAMTGGRIFDDTFRLVNDVPLLDFRLDRPSHRLRLPRTGDTR
jgi:hypothetical protein